MKSVLISIKPKWCELIASGKKTIEVRKTRPKIETPFKCYIYMTIGCVPKVIHTKDFKTKSIYEVQPNTANGRVIGEFVCDKVYNLVNAFGGIMFADENLNQLEPQLFRDMSCLTDEQTSDYLGNKDGYVWHISDLKIYDKPKELSEFKRWNRTEENSPCAHTKWLYGDCKNCNACNLTRPPQSWCYVDELEEKK